MKTRIKVFFLFLVLSIFHIQKLHTQTPPPQAVAVGYTRLAFYDDFNSTATIDMEDTRTEGFNWYRARPYGWASTPKDSIVVENGYLIINSIGGPNYGIGSNCRKDGSIIGFSATGGAYFEASISFDPDVTGAKGWPSFWSLANENVWNHVSKGIVECDFFEYIIVKGIKTRYMGAIHWWIDVSAKPKKQVFNNGNYFIDAPNNWKTNFNTVGTLWDPGKAINFYFNDSLKTQNLYSVYPEFAGGDTQHWPVILGSDGWPMKVDWVRVWVKDTIATKHE